MNSESIMERTPRDPAVPADYVSGDRDEPSEVLGTSGFQAGHEMTISEALALKDMGVYDLRNLAEADQAHQRERQ